MPAALGGLSKASLLTKQDVYNIHLKQLDKSQREFQAEAEKLFKRMYKSAADRLDANRHTLHHDLASELFDPEEWIEELHETVGTAWMRAAIEGAETHGSVDIHSLRVTFATLALENGASPKAVQAILGHSTLAMTMNVYAKATERSKRAAIGSIPFAKASGPDHVLSVSDHSGYKSAQESAQVIPITTKPLKIKAQTA